MRVVLLRWVVPILLAVAASRCFVLAAYNIWAAGGPPVKTPEAFAARGDLFSLAFLACVVLAGVSLWASWRK